MRATFDKGSQALDGRAPAPTTAIGASIPSCTWGWDAISNIASMPPDHAIRLINWFPQTGYIELRRGFDLHSHTQSGAPVETVAAYMGANTSLNKLFAASDDTIYDVTTSSASAEVTGLSNARFQFINFSNSAGNYLYMVNGADKPQLFDGTNWSEATITGTGIQDLIHVNAYKGALWFVIDGTTDSAFLPPDSIHGAATKFPLGAFFTNGGYLNAIATWSLDGGNGPDDYIAFISSQGQVAIFTGSDFTDPDLYSIVGVYDMGQPIGRRCFEKVGSDIAVICLDGVVPLSKSLTFDRAAVAQIAITNRIQRVMNESARLYKDHFGWQLISYARGTRAILNVPINENNEQQQYVMNTLTGAWCQFIGMDANCWEIFEDRPFFGDNEGRVFEADKGGTDYGTTLQADMSTAFNYFKLRGNQKQWKMCRPQLTTDSQASVGLAFNVDFQDNAPIATPTTPSQSNSVFGTAVFNTSTFAGDITTQSNWTSVTGLGYCASIRMVVNISPTFDEASAWGTGVWGTALWATSSGSEITLQVNSFDLLYEKGSIV